MPRTWVQQLPPEEHPWVRSLQGKASQAPVDILANVFGQDAKDRPENCGLYLFRNFMPPEVLNALQTAAPTAFSELEAVYGKKGCDLTHYKTFQAVSSHLCTCKYGYTGTSRHVTYHRDPLPQGPWATKAQPPALTNFIKGCFGFTDPLAPSKDNKVNLLVVNQYGKDPRGSIPWHDDHMELSVRNEADYDTAAVISCSMGNSTPFCIMPNRGNAAYWHQMAGTKKWTRKCRARVCFWLHHGDVLVMSGHFQKFFQHKTLTPSRWPQAHDAVERNWSLLLFGDEAARFEDGHRARWNITGRAPPLKMGGGCHNLDLFVYVTLRVIS